MYCLYLYDDYYLEFCDKAKKKFKVLNLFNNQVKVDENELALFFRTSREVLDLVHTEFAFKFRFITDETVVNNLIRGYIIDALNNHLIEVDKEFNLIDLLSNYDCYKEHNTSLYSSAYTFSYYKDIIKKQKPLKSFNHEDLGYTDVFFYYNNVWFGLSSKKINKVGYHYIGRDSDKYIYCSFSLEELTKYMGYTDARYTLNIVNNLKFIKKYNIKKIIRYLQGILYTNGYNQVFGESKDDFLNIQNNKEYKFFTLIGKEFYRALNFHGRYKDYEDIYMSYYYSNISAESLEIPSMLLASKDVFKKKLLQRHLFMGHKKAIIITVIKTHFKYRLNIDNLMLLNHMSYDLKNNNLSVEQVLTDKEMGYKFNSKNNLFSSRDFSVLFKGLYGSNLLNTSLGFLNVFNNIYKYNYIGLDNLLITLLKRGMDLNFLNYFRHPEMIPLEEKKGVLDKINYALGLDIENGYNILEFEDNGSFYAEVLNSFYGTDFDKTTLIMNLLTITGDKGLFKFIKYDTLNAKNGLSIIPFDTDFVVSKKKDEDIKEWKLRTIFDDKYFGYLVSRKLIQCNISVNFTPKFTTDSFSVDIIFDLQLFGDVFKDEKKKIDIIKDFCIKNAKDLYLLIFVNTGQYRVLNKYLSLKLYNEKDTYIEDLFEKKKYQFTNYVAIFPQINVFILEMRIDKDDMT